MGISDLSRRSFLGGLGAVALSAGMAAHNKAFADEKLPMYIVRYTGDAPANSLHVSNERGYMYRILGGAGAGYAVAYPIGRGQDGMNIPPGTALKVTQLDRNPTWTPTPDMKKRRADLRGVGTVEPGRDNPLGLYSMRLAYMDGRATTWRIHMSPHGDTIGYAVSSGCIHMYEDQIKQFFDGATLPNGLVLPPVTEELPVRIYVEDVPGIEDKGPRKAAKIPGLKP